jgi:hypothetical protein
MLTSHTPTPGLQLYQLLKVLNEVIATVAAGQERGEGDAKAMPTAQQQEVLALLLAGTAAGEESRVVSGLWGRRGGGIVWVHVCVGVFVCVVVMGAGGPLRGKPGRFAGKGVRNGGVLGVAIVDGFSGACRDRGWIHRGMPSQPMGARA